MMRDLRNFSHLLSPLLLVFPLVTHDLWLHKFGQHFPPNEAQSLSSLHFGVHVVTCELNGHSGLSATVKAKTAKTITIWINFMLSNFVAKDVFLLRADRRLRIYLQSDTFLNFSPTKRWRQSRERMDFICRENEIENKRCEPPSTLTLSTFIPV